MKKCLLNSFKTFFIIIIKGVTTKIVPYCHDSVQEVARKSQETWNEETKNFF